MNKKTTNWDNWQAATDNLIKELPYSVAEWLLEFGSLTEKLQVTIQQSIQLKVLQETQAVPEFSESKALGLASDESAMIREVLLYGSEAPWVFARTIVPQMAAPLLQSLGNKPLGSILFSNEDLHRQFLQVRQLKPRHRLSQSSGKHIALDGVDFLWARRSLWQNKQAENLSLLVSEVFLPASPLYK